MAQFPGQITLQVMAVIRSPTGASAALLMKARQGKVTLSANVALALQALAGPGR